MLPVQDERMQEKNGNSRSLLLQFGFTFTLIQLYISW